MVLAKCRTSSSVFASSYSTMPEILSFCRGVYCSRSSFFSSRSRHLLSDIFSCSVKYYIDVLSGSRIDWRVSCKVGIMLLIRELTRTFDEQMHSINFDITFELFNTLTKASTMASGSSSSNSSYSQEFSRALLEKGFVWWCWPPKNPPRCCFRSDFSQIFTVFFSIFSEVCFDTNELDKLRESEFIYQVIYCVHSWVIIWRTVHCSIVLREHTKGMWKQTLSTLFRMVEGPGSIWRHQDKICWLF